MKNKLYVLIACLLFVQAAMAQNSFGVKIGTNLTKIDGYSFDEKFKYGYLIGGYLGLKLNEKTSLQPELLFFQSQTKVDSNFKNSYQNVVSDFTGRNVKLNYLAIPILLDYKLIGNLLSLQAGPQFGILIDQNKNLLQNGQEAFKKGNFSMLAGAQLNISRITASARYVIGLSNIKDVKDIGNQSTWKSQGIQFAVGLNF